MIRRPLLSRVANSLYWISRYMERAENIARFIDVNVHLTLGSSNSGNEQWQPLIDTSGDAAAFKERHGEARRESVIRFLGFDRENPNSIASCLRAARENARTIRETITMEMWEQVNLMYLALEESGAEGRALADPLNWFRDIKRGSHQFRGITDATLSHDEAWHFGRLGRLIERADKTTRLLDVKYFLLLPNAEDVGTNFDDVQWAAVLRSVTGFMMYRKRHGRINPVAIADFLLLDRYFPRSVLYCLSDADVSLHAITGTPEGSFRNKAERTIGKLRSEMEYTAVGDIMAGGLHEYLDGLQSRVNEIDTAIAEDFWGWQPASQGQGQS